MDKSGSSKSFSSYRKFRSIVCSVRDSVVSISGQKMKDGKLLIKHGNGFFVKKHFIICPSHLVLDDNKYVFMDNILVTVSNVNGDGKSICYLADIIGIDGYGNCAVLKINSNSWNDKNPQILDRHPFLHWGKSRDSCPGDKVFLIGEIAIPDKNMIESSENAVEVSYISDNRYVSYGGLIPGELLLLSGQCSNNKLGIPVISKEKLLLGMCISNTGNSIALSEFFMRRPIKSIIAKHKGWELGQDFDKFLTWHDNVYYYEKSWLGLRAVVASHDDLNTFLDNDFSRTLLVDMNHSVPKIIEGYRIMAISDLSPLLNIISVGDILCQINDYVLGDRKHQISPSTTLWKTPPGSNVKILCRKQLEKFSIVHCIEITTLNFPQQFDYPIYLSGDNKYPHWFPI